ncbi:hypothetical protein LTS18_003693, partial [Coniosporium uncinatum]
DKGNRYNTNNNNANRALNRANTFQQRSPPAFSAGNQWDYAQTPPPDNRQHTGTFVGYQPAYHTQAASPGNRPVEVFSGDLPQNNLQGPLTSSPSTGASTDDHYRRPTHGLF